MRKYKKSKNHRRASNSLVDEKLKSLEEMIILTTLLGVNLENRFNKNANEDLGKIIDLLESCMVDMIETRLLMVQTRSFDQRKLNQIAEEIAKIYAMHEAFNVTRKSNS